MERCLENLGFPKPKLRENCPPSSLNMALFHGRGGIGGVPYDQIFHFSCLYLKSVLPCIGFWASGISNDISQRG